jgi:hypothetical protein
VEPNLVPKGRKDSARGFNLRLTVQHAQALKGRQKSMAERCDAKSNAEPIPSAPSGRVVFLSLPGVETRAESLRPFGTRSAPLGVAS